MNVDWQCFCYRIWIPGAVANLFGLALMSFDHFVAMHWPLRHCIILSKRNVIILIGCTWIFSVFLGSTYHLRSYQTLIQVLSDSRDAEKHTDMTFNAFCDEWILLYMPTSEQSNAYYRKNFTITSVVTAVVLIILAPVYCYIAKVAIRARKTKSFYQRHSLNSLNDSNLSSRVRMKHAKGICTTVLLITSFILLWSSVLIIFALIQETFSSMETIPPSQYAIVQLDRYLIVIVCCTTVVDVIIYFMRSQEALRLFHFARRKRSCAE